MNIKITYSWLLEYLDTKAYPHEIQKYLSLCGPSVETVNKIGDDYVFDIEITSNRVDTASVYGVAREAAVILNQFGVKAKLKPLSISKFQDSKNLPLEIQDSSKLCKRILAVVLDNVEIKKSPSYVSQRLEAAGIRSLNNAVDITNYVMTEVGHPIHVFDYDRIATHKLIIRHAKENEEIITLDEKKYNLSNQDIVIDDGTGKVIDLPGIMGTENSVVVDKTKRVILFIESNDPVSIRKSSTRYGIRTVAASINEKNPDPELAKTTFLRGVDLFRQLTGARVASQIFDIYLTPYKEKKIPLDTQSIRHLIGIEIGDDKIKKILGDLGFKIYDHEVGVPSWRQFDINIKEDLVEEVARVYGYNKLPNNLQPVVYIKQPPEMEKLFKIQNKIKYLLKHLGLNEVMNYSMISKSMITESGLDVKNHLRLSNSISKDIEYLRSSLIPSLIKNLRDNTGKKDKIKLFEIAKVYLPRPNSLPEEPYKLGIIVNTDYFDLKGIIESILKELNIVDFQFKISNNDESFACEIDLKKLIDHYRPFPGYKPVNPYALIKLDKTFTLSKSLTYAMLQKKAMQSRLLQKIEIISLYKNKLSVRFFYQAADRNLTEKEALKELDKLENKG